jgi:hypothetical protein
MDNTAPVCEEISLYLMVSAVYTPRIRFRIAIYEIWLYNKLIMV